MSEPPVVTGAAIDAAAAVIPDRHLGFPGGWEPAISRADVERMLTAAAPHLAYAVGAAAGDRMRQLEQLAGELLGSYHKGSDGYRGRVGQVQIARWQAVLTPPQEGHST